MPSKKSSTKSRKTSTAAAPADDWGDFTKRFTLIMGGLELFKLASALAYMKRHNMNWKEYFHKRNANPVISDADVLGWK